MALENVFDIVQSGTFLYCYIGTQFLLFYSIMLIERTDPFQRKKQTFTLERTQVL